jgi:hypothetical protein
MLLFEVNIVSDTSHTCLIVKNFNNLNILSLASVWLIKLEMSATPFPGFEGAGIWEIRKG